MNDEQKIAALAKFVQIEEFCNVYQCKECLSTMEEEYNEDSDLLCWHCDAWNSYEEIDIWNPLTDHNHYRQVELRIMDDQKLFIQFCLALDDRTTPHAVFAYAKATLEQRVAALISILPSEK